MIKLIEVDKIFEHPGNPRNDLGDLTELVDSIKESGVLQNLTLVKRMGSVTGNWIRGTYTVIIGHRRLAAAKLAGLKEVPCIIADMDEKTQVATMLLENMQRVDLTVYEQAQGFQMMINMGETVSNISEKTGFSETTVRNRTKLLVLDQEKLKKSNERGGTLKDYIELSKIESKELRNEVLESVGTNEFNWKLRQAKDKERRKEWEDRITSLLSSFATKVEDRGGNFDYIRSYNDTMTNEDIVEPEDVGTRKYFYQVHRYGQITLYAETEEKIKEEDKRIEEERAKKAEKDARINEIKERSSKLRKDFIYSLTNTKLVNHIGEILLLAIETRMSFYMWAEDYIKAFKLEVDEEDFEFEKIEKHISTNPELSLLKMIYITELERSSYFNFRGEYSEDKGLDMLYNLLEKLGYKISEEEIKLKEGTHELFGSDD